MVDIIRTVKSIMDAHGAWIFGGAVLGALTAHIHKKRSFDADWFQVTCYGCGRSGFSDEFAGVTAPDGRQAYQCVRCQRPDLFKQAEFIETPDTIAAYNQGFADCEAEAEKIPLLIKVIEDDPHDYEIDDYLLIVDDEVREVSGNMEIDYLENHGYDIPYHIVSIDAVNPYQITIQDQNDGESFDAEGVDYSTIVYRVRVRDVDGASDGENYHYRTADRAMEHVNNVIAAYDWYGFEEVPAPGERRKWKTTSGEDWEILMTPIRLGNIVREAEATNPCPHCEGAAGFPREFYYQSDRIEMVPCGTCLTQGRCPGCMEIYPGLSRDNTPEDVFFGSGCDRCGYSESDAREARKTARRWVELVDNPAASKFMAEGGRRYKGMAMKPLDRPDRGENCDAEGCYQPVERRRKTFGWVIGFCESCDMKVDGDRYDAEDYGVGAVWMADSYDPAIHGNTIPTGSVKRFLDKIPMGQMFHVDFVKSNGDIREMDAFFNKPFDTDSMVANVMERTGTGAVFKRFRVDRVVGLYRI